jgi:GNAT superfamily N-acetyltransferase
MTCDGPVHLRRATVDDAAGIAAVHADGWRQAYLGIVPDDYLKCVSASSRVESWREELSVEADDREPWIALLDDDVIGFIAGGLSRDGDAAARTGEVYQLFVLPECWSRGIRTNLVDHLLRDLREHGFERVSYWVIAADLEARRFVEHLGWTTDGAAKYEECGGVQVEHVRYGRELS